MAVIVDHDVVWFHVAVDNVPRVKGVESAQNFGAIEKHPIFALFVFAKVKIVLVLEDPEQVLARQVFEDKIDILVIYERFVQFHDKVLRFFGIYVGQHASIHGVLVVFFAPPLPCVVSLRSSTAQNWQLAPRRILAQQLQNVLLVLNVLDSLCLINGGLGDELESVQFAILDDEIDWPELAISNLDARVAVPEFLGWHRCRLLTLLLVPVFSPLASLLKRAQIGPSHHELLKVLGAILLCVSLVTDLG